MPDKLRQVLATTPRLAEYVVPAANGGDMTLSAFRRLWTSHVRRQVGFELHPHMLRHTYATMLYRAGVDLPFEPEAGRNMYRNVFQRFQRLVPH